MGANLHRVGEQTGSAQQGSPDSQTAPRCPARALNLGVAAVARQAHGVSPCLQWRARDPTALDRPLRGELCLAPPPGATQVPQLLGVQLHDEAALRQPCWPAGLPGPPHQSMSSAQSRSVRNPSRDDDRADLSSEHRDHDIFILALELRRNVLVALTSDHGSEAPRLCVPLAHDFTLPSSGSSPPLFLLGLRRARRQRKPDPRPRPRSDHLDPPHLRSLRCLRLRSCRGCPAVARRRRPRLAAGARRQPLSHRAPSPSGPAPSAIARPQHRPTLPVPSEFRRLANRRRIARSACGAAGMASRVGCAGR
jgi:hypothetical protein